MHTVGCPSSQDFEDGTEETVAEVQFRVGEEIVHVCGTAGAEGHAQVALMEVFRKHFIVHIHYSVSMMVGATAPRGPRRTQLPYLFNFL